MRLRVAITPGTVSGVSEQFGMHCGYHQNRRASDFRLVHHVRAGVFLVPEAKRAEEILRFVYRLDEVEPVAIRVRQGAGIRTADGLIGGENGDG